jgi:hypothetical protein
VTPEYFKTQVLIPPLIAELHSMLWLEPFMNKGHRDEGWNCREHTLFIGFLGMLHGFGATAVSGRAMFVQGPGELSPPGGLLQDPHWWVHLENIGSFDLSMRFLRAKDANGTDWSAWREAQLIGGKIAASAPIGYYNVDDPNKYENLWAAATHQPSTGSAVYLRTNLEALSCGHAERAMSWCNSPLTDRLKKMYPGKTDLYAKAVLRLDEIARGRGTDAVSPTSAYAWGAVAKREGNGRAELARRLKATGW